LRSVDTPEVLEVHVVASVEVRMVPVRLTATYNPLEVVVVVSVDSSFSLQEKTVRLKRKKEMKMISICLTWFPFSELGETNI